MEGRFIAYTSSIFTGFFLKINSLTFIQEALGLHNKLNLRSEQETMMIIQVWIIFNVFTTQEAPFSFIHPVHGMALVDGLAVLANR